MQKVHKNKSSFHALTHSFLYYNNTMNEIIQKAEITHSLSKEEITELLKDISLGQEIFDAADRVRKKYVGDEVHLRGLIEFSNICKQNCLYCGLRGENPKVQRYRLEPSQILDFAQKTKSYGYKTVVLQSGEDDSFSTEKMCFIISEIKKLNLAITLSIGEKTFDEYKAYKQAGADRYLLRIESTDEELYKKMHPKMSWANRFKCLENLKTLGFEVGTGCLVGLPGQSFESLADDILFFKTLDADMIGIGPFIPNENTPLKTAHGGSFSLARKVMALTRLLLPDINIPATTAMETLDENGRILALQSGANVVMPNVTEGDYRKFYEIYPGKICINDTPAKCKGCITGKIQSIGRSVSSDFGFRKKA